MEPADFDSMNETDVREIVVRPLLGRLGYKHGTDAAIRTEVSLRYGHAFLGRKKSSDPPLAGRADYICEAFPFGRWVVEVKAPYEPITRDAVEQAHTYAAHPEVAAWYFLVTNGREWQLFETSRLDVPLLEWHYDQTDDKILSLFNIVSPEALKKRANLVVADTGKPLGRGLASRLEITGGEVVYEDHFTDHPLLSMADVNGLRLPITAGFVERDAEGMIHAQVKIASAAPMMKDLLAALGDDSTYDLFCADEYVSTDVNTPSIFKHRTTRSLQPGRPITLPGMGRSPAPFGMRADAITEAIGYFDGDRFRGTMQLTYDYQFFQINPQVQQALAVRFGNVPTLAHMTGGGTFEVRLVPA